MGEKLPHLDADLPGVTHTEFQQEAGVLVDVGGKLGERDAGFLPLGFEFGDGKRVERDGVF
jgi:hypothetical protein